MGPATLLAAPVRSDPRTALSQPKSTQSITLRRTNEPGVVSGSRVQTLTAHGASRVVTLEGPEGKRYVVQVAPEVPLDRVKVGDRLIATFTVAIAVSVDPTCRPWNVASVRYR